MVAVWPISDNANSFVIKVSTRFHRKCMFKHELDQTNLTLFIKNVTLGASFYDYQPKKDQKLFKIESVIEYI